MNLFRHFNMVVLCVLGLSCFAATGPQAEISPEKNPIKTFYEKLSGEWHGSYSLWLRPGTPAQKSEITVQFKPTARGNYFLMNYSWEQGGNIQEGVFLLGGHGKAATATWGDSFHMVPEPMQCKGRLSDDVKKLIIKGSYSVGKGPAWGWRTEFTLHGAKAFLMEAYNIMPNGVEDLAVKAMLERVSKKQ